MSRSNLLTVTERAHLIALRSFKAPASASDIALRVWGPETAVQKFWITSSALNKLYVHGLVTMHHVSGIAMFTPAPRWHVWLRGLFR